MSAERIAEMGVFEEKQHPTAEKLTNHSPEHLEHAAQGIYDGKIAVVAFNGIYGIFGHGHNPDAANRISIAKQRPHDKKLVLVSAPDHLEEHVDTKKLPHSLHQLNAVQQRAHALGFILPASEHAPRHLVSEHSTVLSIWTEEPSFRYLMEQFRLQSPNARAFVGTSANKSNEPTHHDHTEVWEDFKHDVDLVVVDGNNFSHIHPSRKKSTTVIDVTSDIPQLHRLGSLEFNEIDQIMQDNNFPPLHLPNEFKMVSSR